MLTNDDINFWDGSLILRVADEGKGVKMAKKLLT